MTALGLGDIGAFPFVDPPDRRQVARRRRAAPGARRARPTAPDTARRLTEVGRQLARLPVDPRLARMVLEADRNGCLREVLVIAAALSIQDPRERPPDKQQAADAGARPVRRRPLGLPRLPATSGRYLREQQQELSASEFRRMCRAEFLHYLRVREWQDLHGQLRGGQVARHQALASPVVTEPDADADRAALDAPCCTPPCWPGCSRTSGSGTRTSASTLGARGARFAPLPGSALVKKPPRWVMAAELVETSRLWGRDLGRIEPEWVEPLAGHLVKRTYSEPHWEQARGGGGERAGHAVRRADRGGRDGSPTAGSTRSCRASCSSGTRWSRATGARTTRSSHANRELLEEVEELEHRAAGATSSSTTRRCSTSTTSASRPTSSRRGTSTAGGRRPGESNPDLLDFERAMLLREDAERGQRGRVPRRTGRQGDLALPLTYQFEPGAAADGVTVHVPLPVLNQVAAGRVRLAGPGPAGGAGHRADPVAAQGAAAQLRPRARPRPRCGRRARPAGEHADGAAARRAGARAAGSGPASSCRPTRGTSPGCPSTCG